MLLAETVTTTGVPAIICTILLIATVIAFILGLAEALGLYSIRGASGNSRFATLVVAVVLLVIYVIVC